MLACICLGVVEGALFALAAAGGLGIHLWRKLQWRRWRRLRQIRKYRDVPVAGRRVTCPDCLAKGLMPVRWPRWWTKAAEHRSKCCTCQSAYYQNPPVLPPRMYVCPTCDGTGLVNQPHGE